jgi:hypothetical protein
MRVDMVNLNCRRLRDDARGRRACRVRVDALAPEAMRNASSRSQRMRRPVAAASTRLPRFASRSAKTRYGDGSQRGRSVRMAGQISCVSAPQPTSVAAMAHGSRRACRSVTHRAVRPTSYSEQIFYRPAQTIEGANRLSSDTIRQIRDATFDRAATRSKWARVEALLRSRAFANEYASARERWRDSGGGVPAGHVLAAAVRSRAGDGDVTPDAWGREVGGGRVQRRHRGSAGCRIT